MRSRQVFSEEVIEKIAEAVADKVAERLSVPQTLVGICGIETMLGYSRNSTAVRKIIRGKDFPRPVPISDDGRPRWIKADIERWIDQKQRQDVMRGLRMAEELNRQRRLT